MSTDEKKVLSTTEEEVVSLPPLKSKKPDDTDFKQQRLPAWQPLLTPMWVIGTFAVVGVVFLIIGILILVASNSVVEVEIRYDHQCTLGQSCSLTIPIGETMDPPVYMYYKLSNYYQNHRRYVKSRSDAQLRGQLADSIADCDPLETAGGSILLPCGLIANSFFNDTFSGQVCDRNGANCGTTLTGAEWNGVGIAWKTDREDKFVYADPAGFPGLSFTNTSVEGFELPRVDNEDFIVWMRTAGLPTFKKLYRKIDRRLEAGSTLVVTAQNNYPVFQFDGEKAVVLSTTSWLGGKNDFLGFAYVTVGALSGLLAILFAVKHRLSPRRLGDMQYFRWSGPTAKDTA